MRRTIVLCGLILALILAACGGDDKNSGRQPTATSSAPQVKVVVSQAPVFTLPDRTAEIIVNLFEGETRRVLGKSAPDDVGTTFFQIDLGNRTGWILESQVQVAGDTRQIALVEAATPTSTPTTIPTSETATEVATEAIAQSSGEVTAVIIVSRAIALTAPSRDAAELTTLLQGEQVKVLRQTLPDALGTVFYEVELGTQRGWVLSSQVEISGDVSTLGIAFVPTASPESVAQGVTSVPTTAIPTHTPTSTPTATLATAVTAEPTTALPDNVTPSPSPVIANDNPSIQVGEAPPLTMILPEGWDQGHFIVPVSGSLGSGDVNMSIYEGALQDGLKGTIWIIWGDFPLVINIPDVNANGTVEGALWPSSIQYLRGLLFQGCNIGLYTDNRQTYDMGGYEGEGTTFSAVSCEGGGSDIAGWWAGVRVNQQNFLFYMGVEPVDRVAEGLGPMQAIIDTLQFVS